MGNSTKTARRRATTPTLNDDQPIRVGGSRRKAPHELAVEYAAGTAVVGDSVGRLTVTENGLSYSASASAMKMLNRR